MSIGQLTDQEDSSKDFFVDMRLVIRDDYLLWYRNVNIHRNIDMQKKKKREKR